MKKQEFKEKYLRELPEASGVYFFIEKVDKGKSDLNFPPSLGGGQGEVKSKKENILYIGKATNLRDRVSSYFSSDIIKTRGTKILSMIENANHIKLIETRNVLEALMLESKLIKEHQPYFNTKEKDNKSYSCVVITKEEFPRVLIMRIREAEKLHPSPLRGASQREANQASDTTLVNDSLPQGKVPKAEGLPDIFGPFTSRDQLTKAMKIVRKIFPYREKCEIPKDDFLKNKKTVTLESLNKKSKACFNFQIGLCPGTCAGKISEKDYAKNIKHIKNILSGETDKLLKDLQKEMKAFSKIFDFENAAKVRDQVYAIEHVRDISLITDPFSPTDSFPQEAKIQDVGLASHREAVAPSGETEGVSLESYDVAHISGTSRVGVMCRFEIINGELEYKKSEYKKFKLKEGINDDIGGLKEMLERRFAHTEWAFPDIVVIDGGETHLKNARKILEGVGVLNFSPSLRVGQGEVVGGEVSSAPLLVSVVKDERHRARDILFDDTSKFVSRFGGKVDYNKFIISANAETHRYAISYHKLLRNKIKKIALKSDSLTF